MMKKVLCWLMVLMLVFTPVLVNAAKDEEKKDPIKIHIFYKTTCPFCQKLHAYLDELEDDKKINYMFEVVDYEVSSNEDNYKLMGLVGEYFNHNVTGVPFYVIGEKYFTGFSEEDSPAQIEEAIKTAYNNEDYIDVVQPIVETGEVTSHASTTESTDTSEGKQNDVTNYIILGITAIVVIAIIFARSNNTYYDDTMEESEDDKPKVESKEKESSSSEEKATAKKTTKSTATKTKKAPKKTTKQKKK